MLHEKLKGYNIILASGSPRRQAFFKELDIPFQVRLKEVIENYPSHLQASEITDFLAELKASVHRRDLEEKDILITSDTIVWFKGRALEKPKDPSHAFEMLSALSGQTHEVISSICLSTKKNQKTVSATTKVKFAELSDEMIRYYIDEFRPFDKAGGYGIQEWIGLIGVESIEGSYFNVVGLPTHLLYENLLEFII